MTIKAKAKRSLKVHLRQVDSLSRHLVMPQAAIFYLANREQAQPLPTWMEKHRN